MTLEAVLHADGPKPDERHTHKFQCEEHGEDEAFLDVRASGWPNAICAIHGIGKCMPILRASLLCGVMYQDYFCAKGLPQQLRGPTDAQIAGAQSTR